MEVHIAILHGRKIVIPDYPPIKLFHFSGRYFEMGKTSVTVSTGHQISIYDKEKKPQSTLQLCKKIKYKFCYEPVHGVNRPEFAGDKIL